MVRPWADAGYTCYCYDLQHALGVRRDGNIRYIGANLHSNVAFPKKCRIAFAFPPCTHLAASGSRWWKGKGLQALAEGISLVGRCCDILDSLGCPWMLENPVGALRTHWRTPDAYFDPCDYGGYSTNPDADAYTKRTCLWVGNGFRIPPPKWVFPEHGSKMHSVGPGSDRENERSTTPLGFARAVFMANEYPALKQESVQPGYLSKRHKANWKGLL